MKSFFVGLFLLVAMTVDVPANDVFIDNSVHGVPVEVKTNYSKHRVSVATSNDVREPSDLPSNSLAYSNIRTV